MRNGIATLLTLIAIDAAALIAGIPSARAQVGVAPPITGYGYYSYEYAYYPPYGRGDHAFPYAGPGPYTPAEDYYRAYDSGSPVVTYTYGPVSVDAPRPAYRTGRYLVRRSVTIARSGSGRSVRGRRASR